MIISIERIWIEGTFPRYQKMKFFQVEKVKVSSPFFVFHPKHTLTHGRTAIGEENFSTGRQKTAAGWLNWF